MKTKSRVWKAVVVNVDDAPRPKKRRTPKDVSASDLASPEVPLQGCIFIASFSGPDENITSPPAPVPVTLATSSGLFLAPQTPFQLNHNQPTTLTQLCLSIHVPQPPILTQHCLSIHVPQPPILTQHCRYMCLNHQSSPNFVC